MTTVRITQRLMVDRSLASMQLSRERLAVSQERLSTGRQINRPSDSPTGTNSAMRLREEMAAASQHVRNGSDGLAWLGRTDSVLTTMVEGVRRGRDLILQGANAGSLGDQARQAIAAELDQIRESMLSLANTKHLGRSIFGGATTGDAYSPAGAYIGSAAPSTIGRTIGTGVTVPINVLGPDAFEAGGTDLFAVLAAASDALRTGGSPGDHLGDLDAVMAKMTTSLADVGTRYGRIETTLTSLKSTMLDMQAALSEVEEVDIPKAIVDLQMQEMAYQAALGATARVLQPSLLDFLR